MNIRSITLNWVNQPLQNTIISELERQEITLNFNSNITFNNPVLLFLGSEVNECYSYLKQACHTEQSCVLIVVESTITLNDDWYWQVLQYGVTDILCCKKHSPELLAHQIVARLKRWQEIHALLQLPIVKKNMIGESGCWQCVLKRTVEVARFTDASALILGESGTGKELFARLMHTLDARPNKGELVILDCSTIVPELSGSEFFGHERGAFTGALDSRDGAFALADGGTLFLDEVGELPLMLQAQLLRVIQEQTYKRVGGNKWKQTHFRLVCATNRDLAKEVKRGRFRADLYYRIAMCTFHLPPLRERSDDILPLARHFLQQLAGDTPAPELDETVSTYLLKHKYNGNVRELKQLVTRIFHRHVGVGPITVGEIPEEDRPTADTSVEDWQDKRFEDIIRRALALGAGLREIGQVASDTAIRLAVGIEEGSLQRAADKLGVTVRALQMRRANQRG
ncbi:MAG: hypothetical protein BWK73_06750 [Thiothrix lacustris]|uniref:Sigma-54 factor interaction domain-containing protein n=1 Tax=Thiothrix lacustris TaxID=525917 RepID=A0A1Y1QXB9_9GAMM|nr:MAG: hypothetical protein BWK73_06750 [Thiothrix lacustris]